MLRKVDVVFEDLQRVLDPKYIQWRIGNKSKDKTKGTALAYLDNRAVQVRLDECVGVGNWRVFFTPFDMGVASKLDKFGSATDLKGFLCTIEVDVLDEEGNKITITRQDGADCTDFESIKGGISGAMKRAGVQFGIGRYLYDLPTVWVDLDSYGNFDDPMLPDWAIPEGAVYEPKKRFSGTQQAKSSYQKQESVQSTEVSNPSDYVVPFGKYKGKTLGELIKTDKKYVEWASDKSNNELFKSYAKAVLGESSVEEEDWT